MKTRTYLLSNLALGIVAALTACNGTSMQNSSSSHWVECERDSECPFSMGAVGCSQSYCVDRANERLEVGGSSGSVGMISGDPSSSSCDPAEAPYVIEYHVGAEDGLRLVVTRPDGDVDYDTFRLFYASGDSGPLVERVVTEVVRARDGGTTNITFLVDGAEALAHFPVVFDEDTEEFSQAEPATVTVGGEDTSAERWNAAPSALDEYSFQCFSTSASSGEPSDPGDPRPVTCEAAYVPYPVGTVRDLEGCGTNVCTCAEDGTWQDCNGVEIECYWGLEVRPCSEMFPDREPGDPVPGDPVTVVDGWVEGNRIRLTLERPTVSCRVGTTELCFDPPRDGSVDLHVVQQLFDCEEGSVLLPTFEYSIGYDLTPLVESLPEGAGLVDTGYGHIAAESLTCEERREVSNEHVESALERFAQGCTTDEDCVVTERGTGCHVGCPSVVHTDQVSGFEVTLSLMETFCEDYADECGSVPVPACVAPGTPACVDSQCSFQ